MNPRHAILCILIVGGLSACAAWREPASTENEAVRLPAAFSRSPASARRDPLDVAWWKRFRSAELNALIAEARTHSHDVAAALARVEQARAQVRLATAPLWPELSGSAGIDRAGRLKTGTTRGENTYATGLTASYEADLWGRLRASRRSARHRFEASVFDHDAVVLTLTADVASTWLHTVALRERLTLAENNVATARQILTFIETRARAGAASPLEVAQQRGLLAAQEDALAALRTRRGETELALGLLLARAGAASVRTASLQDIDPPSLHAGAPSALLTRRPDLARAEAELAAAQADIHAARAALLPRLTFRAGLDVTSPSTTALFSQPLYQLASGLTAPIFQGGRLQGEADQTVALREELLANYRQAILTAFGEVETALLALHDWETRRRPQEEQLAQARRAFDLSEARYRAGAETLLTLLTTQQALYQTQDTHLQWRLARLHATLALYKALGGGWER